MADGRPKNITLPPRRVFGGEAPADAEDQQAASGSAPASRAANRTSGRVSFSTVKKPSFIRRIVEDEEAGATDGSPPERPPIPSALQPGEGYTTPLPALSMVVLSITMLGEFLSANVSAPWILFMVQSFGQFEDESQIGAWTGILASTFFLTQFLTSLLWATIAAKHGPRIVISISLLGSAITCCLFGTSTSIHQAIAIRLMQGIFAGAIGVARGCVTSVTDQSNEGRAYAILGFCWGFGGVAGAIVGGTFESPARKWPSVFADIPIFTKYPYLLPCAVAASVTFIGSILSLFLGPDCGPREGAIRLLEKDSTIPEEGETTPSPVFDDVERPSLYGSLRKKVSGVFSRPSVDASESQPSVFSQQSEPMPLSTPSRTGRPRDFSRTSRADSSAYGYGGTVRPRLGSNAIRRLSSGTTIRGRRESAADFRQSLAGGELNFAQRLLMANSDAVTNIADLWVASAMNADNEEVFEDEVEADEFFEALEEDQAGEQEDIYGILSTVSSPIQDNRSSRQDMTTGVSPRSISKASTSTSRRLPLVGSPRRPSSSRRFSALRNRSSTYSAISPREEDDTRRYSVNAPSIFSHVGVRTPPAVLEAQKLLQEVDEPLAPIMEGQRAVPEQDAEPLMGKEPSLMSQLPILIIIQYGLLALHSTTHDQVFYLYLVSKYPLGGLGLDAGNFSQLIALMCLAQIAYQFYLYPNMGPPRGRFSHLAMFRIGSLLFIPSYLSVILYRVMANNSGQGSFLLMAALAVSTAIRFCGSTFAYTAVSVLLNYMSPPHLVGFANGIAQSIVSLARFMGPILGGTLWSMSVRDGPSGYPLGFLACSVACALAVAHSFLIR